MTTYAGPRVQPLLQPLVRRDGRRGGERREPDPCRRGTLDQGSAEDGQLAGAHGVGRGAGHEQPDEHPGQGRVHPRGEGRCPDGDPQHDVRREAPDPQPAQQREHRQQQRGGDEGAGPDVLGVEDRHDGDGPDVVHHGQREQEQPELVGAAGAEQREDPEDERRVARHHDAPPVRRRAGVVDQQVDADRQQHPADRTARRDGGAAPVAQLAGGHLAADLQAQHEEEHRHRRVVDHVLQVEVESLLADQDLDRRLPEREVARRPGRVRPDQGGQRGGQQDGRAARLVGDETADGRGHLGRRDAQRRSRPQGRCHGMATVGMRCSSV